MMILLGGLRLHVQCAGEATAVISERLSWTYRWQNFIRLQTGCLNLSLWLHEPFQCLRMPFPCASKRLRKAKRLLLAAGRIGVRHVFWQFPAFGQKSLHMAVLL